MAIALTVFRIFSVVLVCTKGPSTFSFIYCCNFTKLIVLSYTKNIAVLAVSEMNGSL